MKLMGLTSNIMSLGGIAIAVGAMVDAAIVVVEQTHKKLEEWERDGRQGDYHRVVIDAVKEVGGPSFFALLVIAVSFLPVLTLEAQEGRLFKPLAYTKNFSMIVAAVLAITLDPGDAAAVHAHARTSSSGPRWLARVANAVLVGKIHSEETASDQPRSHPAVRTRLRAGRCAGSGLVIAARSPSWPRRFRCTSGSAPSSCRRSTKARCSTCRPRCPASRSTEAQRLLQTQDRIIKQFPEVERVLGQSGPRGNVHRSGAVLDDGDGDRAEAARRSGAQVERWYSTGRPSWLRPLFRPLHAAIASRPTSWSNEMNEALQLPGHDQRLDDADQGTASTC